LGEILAESKIFVGMPVYNSVPAVCMGKFVGFFLRAAKAHNAIVDIVDSVGVDLARNFIVEHFLKSDASHLLFIDSDMLLPADLLERLLAHNKDVVSALYFGRTQPEPMFRVKKGGKYSALLNFPKNTLFKADSVGLGACLIKRTVIEKVSESLGQEEPMFKFTYSGKAEIVGEDTGFCEKAIEAGFKIFVDTGLEVKHFGGLIDQHYCQR